MSGRYPGLLGLRAAAVLCALGSGCSATPRSADDAEDVLDSAADEADGASDVPTEDAGSIEGTEDTPVVADPVLERRGTTPCGDWEPVARTAPAAVPEGVEGLSLKWMYTPTADPDFFRLAPGVEPCCTMIGALAERPDGDICFVGGYWNSIVCVGRDGTLQWGYRVGGDSGVRAGPMVTPDGLVLAISALGRLWAFRETPEGVAVAWSVMVDRITEEHESDAARRGMAVLAGGYVMVGARYPPDHVLLYDRCGRLMWVMRGLPLVGMLFSVGDEGIGRVGQPPVMFALSTDGTFTSPIELVIGMSVWGPGATGLGGPNYGVVVTSISPTRLSTPVYWYSAERGGVALPPVVLQTGGEFRESREFVDYYAAVAQDGAIVLTQEGVHPSLSPTGYHSALTVFDADGTRRWTHVFEDYTGQLSPPVIGRDGRVLVVGSQLLLGDERLSTLYLFATDGSVEATLEFPGLEWDGHPDSSSVLSPDGVFYFAAERDWSDLAGPSLVAVQTPVAGALPDDPGAPLAVGRTNQRDYWSR